jgi:GTP-sensing pleiotropic transcriptional regulator CodY
VWTVPVSTTSKFVLLALADNADDAGVCVAVDQHLAKKCGMTVDAILRAIRALESAGRLVIDSSEDDVLSNMKRYILALN